MIERTADICVKNETYQNNLIKTQDTLSKAYQDNLKNLTDTMNINVKIVYLWCCAPGLNVHISESVFVSFVGNSQFSTTEGTISLSARACQCCISAFLRFRCSIYAECGVLSVVSLCPGPAKPPTS